MPAMPPPEPQGQPESVTFSRFDGLKNTVSLERLGSKDLVSATNIDLDDDGEAHRRRGYTQVVTGNFHSLYTSEDGVIYGVCNGDLGIINPDYSVVALQSGIGEDPTAGGLGLTYVQVGKNIYFTSLSNNGIIDTKTQTVGPWGPSQDFWFSPVVDPSATLPAIRGRLLGPPPLASFLAYFNGRLYLGTKNVLWATEMFAYGLVDKTKGFTQFEGDLTMIGEVTDGLYIGTTEGVWFLEGPSYPLKRTRVMDSPAIPGSMVYVPGELANPPQIGLDTDTTTQVSVMFMTTRGVCVGMDGGKTYNLTESKFFFPVAKRSFAFFRRQDGMNQYITVNDSEGQLVNGARIGAYVDPEIVRGNSYWVNIMESINAFDTAGAV
jgi:hypothetical protein